MRTLLASLTALVLLGVVGCGGGSAATTSNTGGSSGGNSGGTSSGTGSGGTTAGSPSVSLSASSLTFAIQNVATNSAAQSVTVSNTGTAALTVNAISPSGDFSETNNCGTSLATGATCTIQVIFEPTAAGTRTGAISIQDNSSNSPQMVTLTGDGSQTAAISVTGTGGGNSYQLPLTVNVQ